MFLTEPSLPTLALGELRWVMDFLGRMVLGRTALPAVAVCLWPLSSAFALPLLLPPLSLPLSVTALADFMCDSSIGSSAIESGTPPSGYLPPIASCVVPIAGVDGRLLS